MTGSGIYKIASIKKPNRFYIGSSKNLKSRMQIHIYELRKDHHHSNKLQHHYNKYGESDLQFTVLLKCKESELIKNEQYFIDTYKPWFNMRPIADSNLGAHWKLSEEENKRKSERQKGRKRPPTSDITREKMSLANLKRGSMPPSRKGIKDSDETREKKRLRMLGKQYSLGNKQSVETKEKRAAKLRGRKRTEEYKNKMKELMSSDDYRSKQRKNMLNYWKIKKSA